MLGAVVFDEAARRLDQGAQIDAPPNHERLVETEFVDALESS